LEVWHSGGRNAARVAAESGTRAPLFHQLGTARAQTQPLQERTCKKLQAEIRRLRTENPSSWSNLNFKKIAGHAFQSAARRYARIKKMSGQYKVAWLSEALLVSRSGY
jgi:hypothetical protein